jgi:ribonuclease Z
MVENLPLRKHKHNGLTIEGYSRAAVQSYWRIPELKIGFDLGGCPWSFTGTSTFLVTHPHLDHMSSLPTIVARRRMMKMAQPTIYMPEDSVEPTERLLKIWQRLDRGRMYCKLVGVKPGDEFELSREHVITVFPTTHTVPSVGYVVWERRKKLRPDLVDKTQDEIRDIKMSGEEVSVEVRVPLVCYTGDTAPAGLDACEATYQSKILITEMTFFRPEHRREKIHKFGHMHLDDLLERADRFQNELIVLTHLSTRYHDGQFRKLIEQRFPENLRDKIMLWV